jgi:hypothetical protein
LIPDIKNQKGAGDIDHGYNWGVKHIGWLHKIHCFNNKEEKWRGCKLNAGYPPDNKLIPVKKASRINKEYKIIPVTIIPTDRRFLSLNKDTPTAMKLNRTLYNTIITRYAGVLTKSNGTGESIISAISLKTPVARTTTIIHFRGEVFRKLKAMRIKGRMFVQNITKL